MRILLHSAYYWPEYAGTAPYVTAPAEHLAAAGHDVHVVAAFPHYPEWRDIQGRKRRLTERRNGVTIHRAWHYIPSSPGTIQRAIYEATLMASGRIAQRGVPTPDAIIGVSPALASGALAQRASAHFKVPYGLIVHDLFSKGATQTGMAGGGVSAALEKVEISVAAGASKLLVLTEAFREHFVARGIEADRIVVAPPWSMRSLRHVDHAQARQSMGWQDDEFICVHAGNMGKKQGLINIVDAASHFDESESERLRFVFVGDGNDRADLETVACEKKLDHVTFLGGADDDTYDNAICGADVLLLNQLPSVSDMSLPSKLSAYLAAGRPVIAAVAEGSAAAAVVHASAGGAVVDPREPRATTQTVREWRSKAPEELDAIGAAGRDYAETQLSAAAILPEYERLAEAIASSKLR